MQELSVKLNSLKIEEHRLLIIYNNNNLLHKSSKFHPQCPQRIVTIIDHINSKKYSQINIIEIDQSIKLKRIQDIPKQRLAQLIKKIQGQNYFDFVEGMWHEGIKKSQMFINIDTYFMKHTFQAALEAVKSTLIGINQLLANQKSTLFSIIRPPGHHSGLKSQPHGFSFFNNIALAAQYAILQKKIKKVMIIDWDVHHGEGTQHLFYKRKDVLFLSMHRYDEAKYFPHIKQSNSQNIGKDEGVGFNINIAWNLIEKKKGEEFSEEESCGDKQYAACFNRIVIPIAHQFNPDLILVSCGFDSAKGDPYGNLKITKYGYMFMTNQLIKIQKPLGLILEGGYNLDVLKWATDSIITTVTDQLTIQDKVEIKKLEQTKECNQIGTQGIQNAIKHISKYWKLEQ